MAPRHKTHTSRRQRPSPKHLDDTGRSWQQIVEQEGVDAFDKLAAECNAKYNKQMAKTLGSTRAGTWFLPKFLDDTGRSWGQIVREEGAAVFDTLAAEWNAKNGTKGGASGAAATAAKRDALAEDLGVDAVPRGMKHQLIQALAKELDRDEFADAVPESNAALAAEGSRAAAEAQRVRNAAQEVLAARNGRHTTFYWGKETTETDNSLRRAQDLAVLLPSR